RQAPDRQARDRAVEQVQLRRRGSRSLDPRAALLRQQWLQGLSRGSPPELDGRPLPDRLADPEDDLRGAGRTEGGRLTSADLKVNPAGAERKLPRPHCV